MSPVTRVVLGWEAASGSSLFPIMSAQLSAWPLMATETQLELEGSYSPPLSSWGPRSMRPWATGLRKHLFTGYWTMSSSNSAETFHSPGKEREPSRMAPERGTG